MSVSDCISSSCVVLSICESDLVGLVVGLVRKLFEVQMQFQVLVLLDRVHHHTSRLARQDRQGDRTYCDCQCQKSGYRYWLHVDHCYISALNYKHKSNLTFR